MTDETRLIPLTAIAAMTLRDYFAARVLQGFITKGLQGKKAEAMSEEESAQFVARLSYMVADAMMKEREA